MVEGARGGARLKSLPGHVPMWRPALLRRVPVQAAARCSSCSRPLLCPRPLAGSQRASPEVHHERKSTSGWRAGELHWRVNKGHVGEGSSVDRWYLTSPPVLGYAWCISNQLVNYHSSSATHTIQQVENAIQSTNCVCQHFTCQIAAKL